MKENIRLINHASLFMKFNKDMSFLTDPWYTGSAFDNGWSLLHENNEKFIENVLNNTNYIYISHEHPDHFSISFYVYLTLSTPNIDPRSSISNSY